MGKYQKIIYFIITIILFVILDIFSRFLYAKSWFGKATLSYNIDPIDVLTLLISSIIAIWLGWFITKKLSAQRFQKEYLISDIKKIEKEIDSIEKKMQDSNIDLQEILNLLNKFKTYIDRFTNSIEIFQIKSIRTDELNDFFSQLYSITTDTESDTFDIDVQTRIEMTNIFSEFIKETREMIFQINNE